MADHAQIRSIDDIERFRAQLLTFVTGARVAVEEAGIDVARQQAWLDIDRRKHWEGELWKRQRKVEEARQSLFRESIGSDRGPSGHLQMQVHRAERAFEEARGKLGRVKIWSRDFENKSLPMVKQIEQLHAVLSVDMGRAVNFLNQSLAAIDAYAARNLVPHRAAPEPEGASSAEPVEPAASGAPTDTPAKSSDAPPAS